MGQFPEGLLIFSMPLADMIRRFTGAETVLLGDVTYGACCVDDFTSNALSCDFLVHYGHSCLVPTTTTCIRTMYVFVYISIDVGHLVDSVKANFSSDLKVVLAGTIQFARSIQAAKPILSDYFQELFVPQAKPLSPGEVLGCTSPVFEKKYDAIIFVADGRFHLESIMIHNPTIDAFRYNPYDKTITIEKYGHSKMKHLRKSAIDATRDVKHWGLILGTLGRQGNPKIFDRITKMIKERNQICTKILLSEIFPEKLKLFTDIDAFIQVGCPRLSIDWGHEFPKPILNPYEATVALRQTEWNPERYPMDFYSSGGGVWTNRFQTEEEKLKEKELRKARRKALKERMKRKKRVKLEYEN